MRGQDWCFWSLEEYVYVFTCTQELPNIRSHSYVIFVTWMNLVKWITKTEGSFQISHFLVAFTNLLQFEQDHTQSAPSFFSSVNRSRQSKRVMFSEASEGGAQLESSTVAY